MRSETEHVDRQVFCAGIRTPSSVGLLGTATAPVPLPDSATDLDGAQIQSGDGAESNSPEAVDTGLQADPLLLGSADPLVAVVLTCGTTVRSFSFRPKQLVRTLMNEVDDFGVEQCHLQRRSSLDVRVQLGPVAEHSLIPQCSWVGVLLSDDGSVIVRANQHLKTLRNRCPVFRVAITIATPSDAVLPHHETAPPNQPPSMPASFVPPFPDDGNDEPPRMACCVICLADRLASIALWPCGHLLCKTCYSQKWCALPSSRRKCWLCRVPTTASMKIFFDGSEATDNSEESGTDNSEESGTDNSEESGTNNSEESGTNNSEELIDEIHIEVLGAGYVSVAVEPHDTTFIVKESIANQIWGDCAKASSLIVRCFHKHSTLMMELSNDALIPRPLSNFNFRACLSEVESIPMPVQQSFVVEVIVIGHSTVKSFPINLHPQDGVCRLVEAVWTTQCTLAQPDAKVLPPLPSSYYLTCNGRRLNRNHTVSSYGLTKDSILRASGGLGGAGKRARPNGASPNEIKEAICAALCRRLDNPVTGEADALCLPLRDTARSMFQAVGQHAPEQGFKMFLGSRSVESLQSVLAHPMEKFVADDRIEELANKFFAPDLQRSTAVSNQIAMTTETLKMAFKCPSHPQLFVAYLAIDCCTPRNCLLHASQLPVAHLAIAHLAIVG